VRSSNSAINVHKKNNIKSEVVTQLLYGDTFKKLKKKGVWIKIRNNKDNYKGFIKNKNFKSNQKNTHKICNLFAALYSKPYSKYKIKNKLSFESKIKVSEKKGGFYKFDHLWIKKRDLKKINVVTKDNFHNIKKFVNVKYKWGGKSYQGIDCSALVQLCFTFNNQYFPRDSKDQFKYLNKTSKRKNVKKISMVNLIFIYRIFKTNCALTPETEPLDVFILTEALLTTMPFFSSSSLSHSYSPTNSV